MFSILVCSLLLTATPPAHPWTEHPLISYQVLSSIREVREAKPVRVEPLESFLLAQEWAIKETLAEVEAWAKNNLSHFMPLPSFLAFEAKGDPKDIGTRFCYAIRVNPNTRFPFYLQLVPGIEAEGCIIAPKDLSPLKDTSDWKDTRFVKLEPGELVSPLLVVVTATDEPDLGGLDVGLYEDNETPYGRLYGFGGQPFGNPNLEYGSQAPFHMGFYHEAWIVKALAGFIKRTYPEYRIYLYQRLAGLALATGHEYWGWRFLGMGLHYVMDLTQPYHTTLMPGEGVLKMLGIAILSLLGIDAPKRTVTQLLSNRHTALEKLQQQMLKAAYLKEDYPSRILSVLGACGECPPWNDRVPRYVISAYSNARASMVDKLLRETLPERFVKDPDFEIAKSEELDQILALTKEKVGQAGIEKLELLLAELFAPLPSYTCSYVRGALGW